MGDIERPGQIESGIEGLFDRRSSIPPEKLKNIWAIAREDAQPYIKAQVVDNWTAAKSALASGFIAPLDALILCSRKARDKYRLNEDEVMEYEEAFKLACEQGEHRNN